MGGNNGDKWKPQRGFVGRVCDATIVGSQDVPIWAGFTDMESARRHTQPLRGQLTFRWTLTCRAPAPT